MDTLTVLRLGRDWLAEDPRRWSPKGFGKFPETACAVSALRTATNTAAREDFHRIAHFALLEAVKAEGFFSIMAFNDNAKTTLADVLRVYDRAIAAEETKLAEAKKKEEIPQAVPRRRENAGCDRELVVA